jgi:hypothetical protein
MDKKLTIVKVITNDGKPTEADLEKWRQIFAANRMTEEEALATGELEIEHLDIESDEDYITLVKIGDEDYKPSIKDLEAWRNVFEEAKGDPDFKIFTHQVVEIELIKLGKIIAVE